jgi:integrase
MGRLDGQAPKAFRSPAEGRPTSTETGRIGLSHSRPQTGQRQPRAAPAPGAACRGAGLTPFHSEAPARLAGDLDTRLPAWAGRNGLRGADCRKVRSATDIDRNNARVPALRHAEGRDLVRRNLSALVDTPHGREGRPSQALTVEQAALLEAAEDSRLHAYIVLCLLTGVRSEEARALSWDHVDLDARTISVWRSVRAHGDTKTVR